MFVLEYSRNNHQRHCFETHMALFPAALSYYKCICKLNLLMYGLNDNVVRLITINIFCLRYKTDFVFFQRYYHYEFLTKTGTILSRQSIILEFQRTYWAYKLKQLNCYSMKIEWVVLSIIIRIVYVGCFSSIWVAFFHIFM